MEKKLTEAKKRKREEIQKQGERIVLIEYNSTFHFLTKIFMDTRLYI